MSKFCNTNTFPVEVLDIYTVAPIWLGHPPKKTTLTEHDFLNVTICWEWHKRILVGGFNPVEKYINILVKMEIIPK